MGLINKNHLQIVVDKVKNRLGDFSKLKTQNIIDDIGLKADNSDLNKVKKQVVVGNETSNDETKIRINSNSTTTVLIPTKAELDAVEAKADAATTKANTNQSKLDNFIVTNDDNVTQNTKLSIDADADEIELATVAELNAVKQNVDSATTNITTLQGQVAGKADSSALTKTNTELSKLWDLNRGVSYDFEKDSTVGDKVIPNGARVVKPLSVGGKCEVVDGSILTADVSGVKVGGANLWDGVTGLNNTSGNYKPFNKSLITLKAGTYTAQYFEDGVAHAVDGLYFIDSSSNNIGHSYGLSYNTITIDATKSVSLNVYSEPTGVRSLTSDYSKRQLVLVRGSTQPNKFIPYRTPVTHAIPTAVRNLTGYGWSAGSVCNDVDFERKKYVQRVGRVDLGTLVWENWGSVGENTRYASRKTGIKHTTNYLLNTQINYMQDYYSDTRHMYFDTDIIYWFDTVAPTSGTILYYELATTIETDISALLTDIEPIECEEGGSVEFVNTNGLSVPNTVEYFVGKKPVQDVQINGSSAVVDGVANVPIATSDIAGCIKAQTYFGVGVDAQGSLFTYPASANDISARTQHYKCIAPDMINTAVKAALTDSKRMELDDAAKKTACETIGAKFKSKWKLIDTVEDYDATQGYSHKYSGQYSDIKIYFYSAPASGSINLATRIGYEDYSNCAYCSATAFRSENSLSIISATVDTPENIIEITFNTARNAWGTNNINWSSHYAGNPHGVLSAEYLNYIMLSAASNAPTTGNKIVVYGKEV